MTAKKIPITPIFKDLPTVAQVVALSTSTIERLEREGQFPKRRQLSGQRVLHQRREVRQPSDQRADFLGRQHALGRAVTAAAVPP